MNLKWYQLRIAPIPELICVVKNHKYFKDFQIVHLEVINHDHLGFSCNILIKSLCSSSYIEQKLQFFFANLGQVELINISNDNFYSSL